MRAAIVDEAGAGLRARIPVITEDTMPGELPNVVAGRIANLFDFHGPSYTTDAACASGLAAMASAIEGLVTHQYDTALAGGIDRNMGANVYVKFCKIGALSATGTRPYADGADGFVMGEGGTVFVLKRLADAERDGDRIYAVLLGIAGSSDGRGKGITAPNPIGQRLAVQRAWQLAGVAPSTCSLMEGHGTSTAVGDVVEVEALAEVFGADGAPAGSIPLGSVKSNIGHLKGAAGTAGLFKAVMALHHRILPATLHAETPNPHIDLAGSPFRLNTETRPWDPPPAGVRRAGVSAFGFGGTNFHAVVEEYVPGRRRERPVSAAGVALPRTRPTTTATTPARGAFVAGASDEAGLLARLRDVAAGAVPPAGPPSADELGAPVRVAIDHGDAAELAAKARRAVQALERDDAGMRRALRAQGVFFGRGPPGEGRVPLPGAGFAVHRHARHAARSGTGRRRDARRGGHGDDAAARPPAHRVRLLRRAGRRAAAAADRDHPARGPDDRHRAHPPARRPRRRARLRDGPQSRRVRRAGGRRLAVVRRRPAGGQRAGQRDGRPVGRGQRRDGGRVRAARARSSGSSPRSAGTW